MSSSEVQIEPLGFVKVAKLTVGATEVQVVLSPNIRTRSVLLEPDTSNSGTISIGETGLVAGTSASPLNGPRVFDVNLANGNVYVIASGAGQILWVTAVTDESGQ